MPECSNPGNDCALVTMVIMMVMLTVMVIHLFYASNCFNALFLIYLQKTICPQKKVKKCTLLFRHAQGAAQGSLLSHGTPRITGSPEPPSRGSSRGASGVGHQLLNRVCPEGGRRLIMGPGRRAQGRK